MLKMRLSVPLPLDLSSLGIEVLSMSSRRTLAGATLSPAATANVTVVAPLSKRFELVGSVKNLFDIQYADPGSDQHLQDAIPQNGRTLRIGLRVKVAAR